MAKVSDIKTFVSALGGARAVADLIGVQPGAVYMATWRNSIPHRWRLPLFQQAKTQKLRFDPALLGLEQV
jgi:hypothetical protein